MPASATIGVSEPVRDRLQQIRDELHLKGYDHALEVLYDLYELHPEDAKRYAAGLPKKKKYEKLTDETDVTPSRPKGGRMADYSRIVEEAHKTGGWGPPEG